MIQPLHDWMLVEIEADTENFAGSSIIRVSENPIRVAKVLAIGKGRAYKDKFVPTVVEPGERVVFFMATTQTQSGAAVTHCLPDNQYLIRETDVLFVTTKDVAVSI